MQSLELTIFIEKYISAPTKDEKDSLWAQIDSPLIEPISDDPTHSLVTFLYRLSDDDIKNEAIIYFYSSITGCSLEDTDILKRIEGSDICSLTLTLPNEIRSTYNFITVDNTLTLPTSADPEIHPDAPSPSGDFLLLNKKIELLFAHKKLLCDTKNPKKIDYPVDFENPIEIHATESILELPNAPQSSCLPASAVLIKNERDELKRQGKLVEKTLTLNDESRKYWIYLPPSYEKDSVETYPLLLFLDGGTYVDIIPVPSIIDNMISDGALPETIAVFFDCSATNRWQEYYCNDAFTKFIAMDFIEKLKHEEYLRIADDPSLRTISGSSASGLAAFYVGITYPAVFGNVIAQSASFEGKKMGDLFSLVDLHAERLAQSLFIIESGSYENAEIELIFPDHEQQTISHKQAEDKIIEKLLSKNIAVHHSTYCGGHNYVCWRVSLINRLIDLFNHIRPEDSITHTSTFKK